MESPHRGAVEGAAAGVGGPAGGGGVHGGMSKVRILLSAVVRICAHTLVFFCVGWCLHCVFYLVWVCGFSDLRAAIGGF